MKRLVKCAVATLLCAGSAVHAGTVVVGGDITPTFALGAPEFGGVAGNRQFYDNLRGGASRITLSMRSFGFPGFPVFYNENLRQFYGATAGVTVTDAAGEITAASLAATDFLIIQFPNFTFTTGEIAAIGGFVRGGGRLFVSGEASTIDAFPPGPVSQGTLANAAVNSLLSGIGATIRVANDTIGCCGNFLTTPGQIATHPLTAGVTSFSYGAATSVTGGSALFFAPVGGFPPSPAPDRAFFAVETLAAVPEPSSWALMIIGFGMSGTALRRRVRQLAA